MPRIKRGTPNIRWTRAQLEAWWVKKGPKVLEIDEIWSDRKRKWVQKKIGEKTLELAGAAENFFQNDGYRDNAEEMPFCCAFEIVGNFPDDLDHLEDNYESYDGVVTTDQKCALLAYYALSSGGGNILSTTIPSQKMMNEILPLVGFKPLTTVTNKNTKNKVTLWLAQA